jgi:hypothetical protein
MLIKPDTFLQVQYAKLRSHHARLVQSKPAGAAAAWYRTSTEKQDFAKLHHQRRGSIN